MRVFVVMAFVSLVVANAAYYLGAPPLLAIVVGVLAAVVPEVIFNPEGR